MLSKPNHYHNTHVATCTTECLSDAFQQMTDNKLVSRSLLQDSVVAQLVPDSLSPMSVSLLMFITLNQLL